MRRIRLSKTFTEHLHTLLEQGVPRFGARLVDEKRNLVYNLIEHYLAHFPAAKTADPRLGLTVYPVAKSPFVVLYDYDDAELRVHFIRPASADRRDLDPASAEW